MECANSRGMVMLVLLHHAREGTSKAGTVVSSCAPCVYVRAHDSTGIRQSSNCVYVRSPAPQQNLAQVSRSR